jgi:hypothetical protein
MENSMKKMILAALVIVAMTAGIAFAGIDSLANGAAVLINASSHPDPYDNTANSLDASQQECRPKVDLFPARRREPVPPWCGPRSPAFGA